MQELRSRHKQRWKQSATESGHTMEDLQKAYLHEMKQKWINVSCLMVYATLLIIQAEIYMYFYPSVRTTGPRSCWLIILDQSTRHCFWLGHVLTTGIMSHQQELGHPAATISKRLMRSWKSCFRLSALWKSHYQGKCLRCRDGNPWWYNWITSHEVFWQTLVCNKVMAHSSHLVALCYYRVITRLLNCCCQGAKEQSSICKRS